MTQNTLSLAVVGHTNTGKTSLMRTLLRDSTFGEVKNAAATTRHVEEALITHQAQPFVALYDTPGLEDAGGILDWLEENTSTQRDGIERINVFLNHDVAQQEFAQEAKVLRQLLKSDMALYVVDAREAVLPKYKDELTILSWCAKPIMPVFNFTHEQNLDDWQAMLARRNLHVSSRFDTVAFDFSGEIRLWHNLATMLPEIDKPLIEKWILSRQQEWQQLDQEARECLAHFLLDCASYCQVFEKKENKENQQEELNAIQAKMHQQVRQLEQAFQEKLLHIYRFYTNDLESQDWILQAFSQNPFDAHLLKEYGIRTGSGMAMGALIGLGVDTMTAGLSLGLGTAIGSVIGGIFSNFKTLSDKLSGMETLYIDPQTLTLLAARGQDLLRVLQSRGHAAQQAIQLKSGEIPWQADKLPDELNKARVRPRWSVLNGESIENAQLLRSEYVKTLAEKLRF